MLVVSLAFVHPVFALGEGHTVALWVLLFAPVGIGQGASGVLPSYISAHHAIGIRAAALGFGYDVGALGGAAAPVLGEKIAGPLGPGGSLAVPGAGLTAVVVLQVGFDVPARVQRAADRRSAAAPGGRTTPVEPPASEKVRMFHGVVPPCAPR
jgi:SHS family sialic acid transporter-like MFS transporter